MTDTWDENILVDIKAWKASFEFYQDYTTGSVWATSRASSTRPVRPAWR
jgi:hypothetical protein